MSNSYREMGLTWMFKPAHFMAMCSQQTLRRDCRNSRPTQFKQGQRGGHCAHASAVVPGKLHHHHYLKPCSKQLSLWPLCRTTASISRVVISRLTSTWTDLALVQDHCQLLVYCHEQASQQVAPVQAPGQTPFSPSPDGQSPNGQSPHRPAQRQQDLPPESLPLLATPPGEEQQVDLPDMSLRQCLAGLNFWLLLFIHLVCTGAGLTILNNVNQMVRPSLTMQRIPRTIRSGGTTNVLAKRMPYVLQNIVVPWLKAVLPKSESLRRAALQGSRSMPVIGQELGNAM